MRQSFYPYSPTRSCPTLVDAFDNASHQSLTENGHDAVSAQGAMKAQVERGEVFQAHLTEWFGQCTRGADLTEQTRELIAQTDGNLEKMISVVRGMFQLRSIRKGKGERLLAYTFFLQLYSVYPQLAEALLYAFVNDHGCWKDAETMYRMGDSSFKDIIVRTFTQALLDGNGSSGKFTPSLRTKCNTASARSNQELAIRITEQVFLDLKKNRSTIPKVIARFKEGETLTEKRINRMMTCRNPSLGEKKTLYRAIYSGLRARYDVTEVKMCDGRFREINPKTTPAKCNTKHRRAFQNMKLKTDEQRSYEDDRVEGALIYHGAMQEAMDTGEGIKGSVSGPHNLVKNYVSHSSSSVDPMFEAQWKVLIKELADKGAFTDVLSLVDVSDSMEGVPMEVAIALGLVVSELASAPWKNRVLTFESTPRFHHIVGETLFDRVRNLKRAPWGGSTDFAAALNLILSTAVENNVPTDGMPKILFVFSDMQFDVAEGHGYYRQARSESGLMHAYASIKEAYRSAGYEVPHIVFWNLRDSPGGQPCETLSEGVSTMSGFSQVMLEAFMDGKIEDLAKETPWDRVKKILEDEAFDDVETIVRDFFAEKGLC